jgi:hypothetical protein
MQPSDSDDRVQQVVTRGRSAAAAIILSIAIPSLAFRAIVYGGLQQTAALFVGVPTILALVVLFAVSPRSATGVACKATALALHVAVIALGEGILCVIISAPLFFLIAIAASVVWQRGHTLLRLNQRTLRCCAVVAALPFALEGVVPATSFDRNETVSASRVVDAAPADVAAALGSAPRFDRALPLVLRAGFPRAEAAQVESRDGHEYVRVRIRGGEIRLDGTEPPTGELVLRVEERTSNRVRWTVVSDSSHTTHYLRWRESIVEWHAAGEGRTTVTWRLRYSRDLDPAWYFGPMQRHVATAAAGFLIDAVATP